ncbi:hypothetical protein GUJ93_ZPchr0003g16709 [Zizania palustris]|uniref:Uncharacterized protein n=1 Tax=Zizania palustris TaxID=103762 RepID=A0A8J5RVE6_ZIZPA|nr:hypothetical protein GUJ93_ZPchr0003g16709 [Zizania palustris]
MLDSSFLFAFTGDHISILDLYLLKNLAVPTIYIFNVYPANVLFTAIIMLHIVNHLFVCGCCGCHTIALMMGDRYYQSYTSSHKQSSHLSGTENRDLYFTDNKITMPVAQ